MPRNKRQKSSTNTYHIVIKGADRQLIFAEEKDYHKYLDFLSYFKSECNFELYAYCLMSNHVHLLIRHSDEISLETIFRRLNTSYAIWYNMKYNRTGALQNNRYYSEPIETVQNLLNVIVYIHLNPFKAGLEKQLGTSYLWNSFHDYKNDDNTLTDTKAVLFLTNTYDNFLTIHNKLRSQEMSFLDVNSTKHRLPDDVAKDIIFQVSHCKNPTEFQKLAITNRNIAIKEINKKGVSIRQLNRLTGTPKGIIERIINNSIK